MQGDDREARRKLERLRAELAKGERDLAAGRVVVIETDEELQMFFEGLENGSSFDERAARFRARTAERRHTPAEELQREGRDER
ncbi:hypothetical protein ACFW16_13200 [Inquilinus sp. NPDC058860]|uniref:hypothetical protein n=1 Tax=Inquilinus sp. NPDC058860 TaxID=3346652 RepID=UPI00368514A1